MGYNGKPPIYGGAKAPLTSSDCPPGLFDMGFLPPPPPAKKGASQPQGVIVPAGELLEMTAIKGRLRRTVKVVGIMSCEWHARIETGALGYPDTLTHANDGDDFFDKAAASTEAGRVFGLWLNDGWQYCENWKAEHSHERMQSAKFRLSDQIKNRKGKPLFTTIDYPEPYHLARYIRVVTSHENLNSDYKNKEFLYDYATAAEANAEAKKRIEFAVSQGYLLMAQSAAKTGENVAAASAAVKLALAAPTEDDYSGLIKSFEFESQTGAALVTAVVQTHLHLDKRFLKRACELQPFAVSDGVFYPLDISQNMLLDSTYRLTMNGQFVANSKAVGGATMPAMAIPKTMAQATAKPPEPPKIRHIELED